MRNFLLKNGETINLFFLLKALFDEKDVSFSFPVFK